MRLPRRGDDPRVTSLLADARGERTLAWGELTDGGVLVATTWALHSAATGRVPWEEVVRAGWSDDGLELSYGAGDSRRQMTFAIAEPGHVPAVVRERVQWCVLVTQHADLVLADGRHGGARLSARRSPQSGEASWSVVFDAGVDPADPAWRMAADRALAQLRDSLGL